MKYLLWTTALFEGIFGAIAAVSPATVFAGADGLALSNARTFGCAAIAIAVLSILAARRTSDRSVVLVVLPTLLVWHVALSVVLIGAVLHHYVPPPVPGVHGAFAVTTLVFLIRAGKTATAREHATSSA